jgi:hypothetical protein
MAGFLRFQPLKTTAQAMLCDNDQFEHAARDIALTFRIPMSPDWWQTSAIDAASHQTHH